MVCFNLIFEVEGADLFFWLFCIFCNLVFIFNFFFNVFVKLVLDLFNVVLFSWNLVLRKMLCFFIRFISVFRFNFFNFFRLESVVYVNGVILNLGGVIIGKEGNLDVKDILSLEGDKNNFFFFCK